MTWGTPSSVGTADPLIFKTKIMSMDINQRERIACDLLGIPALEVGGYAACPGAGRHTKGGGRRDFKVTLETVPTGFCFHSSCSGEVEEFNLKLRRAIWRVENGDKRSPASSFYGVTAPAPQAERVVKRPPFDPKKLQEMAENVKEVITREWLMAVSPMSLKPNMRGVGDTFLEALYEDREKVLIFTELYSQGDYGYHVGAGGWRLGRDRGVKPVKSDLPLGGAEGVWFLCNPVSGEWKINSDSVGYNGQPKWGRRHGACVTAWRYLVLENDVAPMAQWLRLLVQLPLQIVAIYTSGGRSVHALVRLDVASKAEWDIEKDMLVKMMAPLGADPAAMTAVRLTRLPGCLRGESLQELWYLDPRPKVNTTILQRRLAR